MLAATETPKREIQNTPAGQRIVSSSSNDDKEINIQVVVRCRGLSEKEKKDKTPRVITVPMITGKDVIYKSGSVNRTYTFDKVFGPDADQETVYQEVAMPILKEVLQGFNCTIFAYGQTGTGKTFTMEGNMNAPIPDRSSEVGVAKGFDPDRLAKKGVPAEAGIIPRVLQRMFYLLDQSTSEYSVSVSHLELYNEELRDLLSDNDDSNSFPFSNQNSSSNDSSRIRLYDDGAGKGGIVIQGLEEKLVRTSNDAIKLLQRGSQKRQVANTKCNEFSSRSHSIFMLTVHIKEKNLSKAGEDLIKIGKLNLVDLAGSENIGRSGAEQRRAREAGMINQSLLTLGRVINSLVDRSPHIPYRESKLTRLLRDSLGGKTKTCLIATIGPSKSSVEETLSTLDYANRAKSIRNRPEANKKVTQTALVGDLQLQIERLQMDLAASHSKNGVFLSAERYKELVEDSDYKSNQADEWKQRVELREAELKTVHNEAKELMNKCFDLEQILITKDLEITEKNQVIDSLETKFKKSESLLKEQRIINKIQSDNESKLNKTANSLSAFLYKLTNEIELFYDKMDRVNKSITQKKKILNDFKDNANSLCKVISKNLDQLPPSINKYLDMITEEFTNTMKNHFGESLDLDLKVISNLLKESVTNAVGNFNDKNIQNKELLVKSLESLKLSFTKTNTSLQELTSISFQNDINTNQDLLSLVENKLLESKILTEDNLNLSKKEFLSVQSRLSSYKEELKNISNNLDLVKSSQSDFIDRQKSEFNKLQIMMSEKLKQQNEKMINEMQIKLEENSKIHTELWKNAIANFEKDSDLSINLVTNANVNSQEKINGFSKVIESLNHSNDAVQDSNLSMAGKLNEIFSTVADKANSAIILKKESKSDFDQKLNSSMTLYMNDLESSNTTLIDTFESSNRSAINQLEGIKENNSEAMNKLNSILVNTKLQLQKSVDEVLIKKFGCLKEEADLVLNQSNEIVETMINSTNNMERDIGIADSLAISSENGSIQKTPPRTKQMDVSEISWKITKPVNDIYTILRGDRSLMTDDQQKAIDIFSLGSESEFNSTEINNLDSEINLEWGSKIVNPDLSLIQINGKSVKRKNRGIENVELTIPKFPDLNNQNSESNNDTSIGRTSDASSYSKKRFKFSTDNDDCEEKAESKEYSQKVISDDQSNILSQKSDLAHPSSNGQNYGLTKQISNDRSEQKVTRRIRKPTSLLKR
ncbi:putative kinesin-related protein [Smittium culicis]|uniref:Putative kinesin-related protein n=1 Tax=Smittium culicis TaxID=133412 RepID=A0A1R1YH07_9FUNG|nr:putative kinesin-related protein [Smittium culicis]